MSLGVALTRPDKVAGVVAMSGRILPEIRPLVAPPEELEDRQILLLHGTEDPMLPIYDGRDNREILTSLPVRLDYREYRMGHYVTEESYGIRLYSDATPDAPASVSRS